MQGIRYEKYLLPVERFGFFGLVSGDRDVRRLLADQRSIKGDHNQIKNAGRTLPMPSESRQEELKPCRSGQLSLPQTGTCGSLSWKQESR